MLKIINYMKSSWKTILVILALLVVQAVCELALPQYTSRIVDVGIQQGGVDETIPSVIRRSEADKLLLFMDGEGRDLFWDAYSLITKENVTEQEYGRLLKKYPAIAYEEVLQLRGGMESQERETLEDGLLESVLFVRLLTSDNEEAAAMKAFILNAAGVQDPSMDVFTVLQNTPPEVLGQIMEALKSQDGMASADMDDNMRDMMYRQMAIQFVRSEYEALGMDMGSHQTGYLVVTGFKMLALALLAMFAMILVTLLASRVGAKVGTALRGSVFHKVVGFSGVEMDRFQASSLITRSTNDIQQIQMVVIMMLRMVAYAPILGIGGVIKVVNTRTGMSWIIAVAVGIILGIVLVLLRIAMPKFKKMQTLVDRVNLVAREILSGLLVIRAFSRENTEEERFDEANVDLTKTQLFTSRTMALMMPTMMFIMNAITVLIVWVGAKGIDLGNLMVGDMMAFITYTMQIVMSFLMITMISIMLPRAAVSATRVDEVLETRRVIRDPANPKTLGSGVRGEIGFHHVRFRYPNAEEDALEDLNFTVKPGETTAIIGSTGCGKSTLVNLIPRLYDVTEGSITLDGVDIREITQKELREYIGFVPQRGILFSGTIESNLKFGVADADEETIREAAEIAQASKFIEEKPEGYDAPIAQEGNNVSGGQKQRLSIARAIAKNPRLYIFDDSFSALDYKTDVALRKALRTKTKDSAVIIVAQRVSTILHAEKILVLDDGRIVGEGTHQELLKENEVYRQIASSQLSAEELASH